MSIVPALLCGLRYIFLHLPLFFFDCVDVNHGLGLGVSCADLPNGKQSIFVEDIKPNSPAEAAKNMW